MGASSALGKSIKEASGGMNIPLPGLESAKEPERIAGSALGIGEDVGGLEKQASAGYGTGTITKDPKSKYLAEGGGQRFGI